ncbi:hypothetical protein Tco_1164859, partial [Tanacetum coccineum]
NEATPLFDEEIALDEVASEAGPTDPVPEEKSLI